MRMTVREAKPLVLTCMADAAKMHGVRVTEILMRGRRDEVVKARQDAMLFASDKGVSSVNIGMHMDRDHSTVLHGIARARQRHEGRAKEPIFKSVRSAQ
ncbi:MAG: helix-turn-helix domain-containing protein [Pseudomonadota bacterium]